MTPIVKEIEKASVKLQPLDLSPNDYVSDFLEKLNAKDDKDEPSKADSMVKSIVDDKKVDENKISKINPISEVSEHKERPVMVSVGLDACDLRPIVEYQNRPPNNDQSVELIDKHDSMLSDKQQKWTI